MDCMDVDGLALIDVCNEDDSLLSPDKDQDFDLNTSPASLLPSAAKETDLGEVNSGGQSSTSDSKAEAEDMEISDPDEPNRKRKTKNQYDLRKSLAWDQAFFTSEGVLDAEELSLLTATGDTSKEQLPTIVEAPKHHGNLAFQASSSHSKQLKPPGLAKPVNAKGNEERQWGSQSHAPSPSTTTIATIKRVKVSHGSVSPDEILTPNSASMDSKVKQNAKVSTVSKQDSRALSCANSGTKSVTGSVSVSNKQITNRLVDGLKNKAPNNSTIAPKNKVRSTHKVDMKSVQFSEMHMKSKAPLLIPALQSPKMDMADCTNTDAFSTSSSFKDSGYMVVTDASKQNKDIESSEKIVGLDPSKPNLAAASNAIPPATLSSKPTGLRKPSPKLGFFDSEKFIRHPSTSGRSTGTCSALPPKPVTNGISGIAPTSKLIHPSVPCPQRVNSNFLPQQLQKIPAPAQASAHRPHENANAEVSGLVLLAQKKFGSSPNPKVSNYESNPVHANDKMKEIQIPKVCLTYSAKNEDPAPANKEVRLVSVSDEVSNDASQIYKSSEEDGGISEEDQRCLVEGNEAKLNGRTPLIASKNTNSCAIESSQKLGRNEKTPIVPKVTGNLVGKENSIVGQSPQTKKASLDAAPFSDEWIAAIEAAGEEVLQSKGGPVQHSPPDKLTPEPNPWSPVRHHSQYLGPFDCTKHTNAQSTSSTTKEAS